MDSATTKTTTTTTTGSLRSFRGSMCRACIILPGPMSPPPVLPSLCFWERLGCLTRAVWAAKSYARSLVSLIAVVALGVALSVKESEMAQPITDRGRLCQALRSDQGMDASATF